MIEGLYTPLCVRDGRLERRGNQYAIAAPHDYAARHWYESTRGLAAFTIPNEFAHALGYVAKRANGAATWYDFADASRLIIGRCGRGQLGRNRMTCGPDRRTMYAERTLWQG